MASYARKLALLEERPDVGRRLERRDGESGGERREGALPPLGPDAALHLGRRGVGKVLEALDRILRRPENAVRPDDDREGIVVERILDRASDRQWQGAFHAPISDRR